MTKTEEIWFFGKTFFEKKFSRTLSQKLYTTLRKMKNTVDFYNKTANEWAESGYNNNPDVPCMFDFAKNHPPGSRFLDLCSDEKIELI